MIRRPPRSTRTDTLFPYTTLFRSLTKTSRLAPIPDVDSGAIIPEPPPLTLALPATILLGHPNVVAAEREAAARWAEIGVARADRLPRIDLVGLLTGNWIRMMGSTTSFDTRSEERRVGTECVSTGRSRWSQYH